MNACVTTYPPFRAALAQLAKTIMDVTLHIGAHRTAATGFQDYLRRHRTDLETRGVAFWGPGSTRRGLFSGLLPSGKGTVSAARQERAAGRIRLRLDQTRRNGTSHLIISDQNMMGSLGNNMRERALYPAVGEQIARFAGAFDGRISAVMLSMRSLDLWWCSALAAGVSRGHPLPEAADIKTIATSERGWRDVIADVACALPGVPLRVLPFEQFAGRPDALFACGAEADAPRETSRQWLSQAPALPELRRALPPGGGQLPFGMGRWNPFDNEQHAALRELYADDIMWLTAGADGLATLTEDDTRTRVAQTQPAGQRMEGQTDEHEKGRLARPG